MIKKIVLLLVVLGLVGGGFFYWWQGHADERALNTTLPEGIRVDKCLLTGEWRVINKIDGYEFKIPPEWKGVREVEYIGKRKVRNMDVVSIGIEGFEEQPGVFSIDRILSIDKFIVSDIQVDLEEWAKRLFNELGLEGDFRKEVIGNIEVVKIQENKHLGGTYVYFLENIDGIYMFNNASEEFIRYIIANGQW